MRQVVEDYSALFVNRKRSTNLQIESDRTFVSFPYLKLHRVLFVQVFELTARREAAAMKENIFAAVIRRDETEAFIADNLFYRTGHNFPFRVSAADC
jgi:hypothetical protein